MNRDAPAGIFGWALPAIITALLSLGAGAFIEQQGRIKELENRLRLVDQQLEQLRSADAQGKYEREELRASYGELRQRQDRVISALSTIDPKLAGSILRNDR